MEHMGKPCKYNLGLFIICGFILHLPITIIVAFKNTCCRNMVVWFAVIVLIWGWVEGWGWGWGWGWGGMGGGADRNNFFKSPTQNLPYSFSSSTIPVEHGLGSAVWSGHHNISSKTKKVP